MAPVFSCIQSHQREQEKAANLLQDARDNAFKTHGYNFIETRKKLVEEFRACNDNKEPYEWQLDVSEALILGLDCCVIAGTGAGKTMPFAMPLYVETEK
jgi:superfamily II DNA/RNA helicase